MPLNTSKISQAGKSTPSSEKSTSGAKQPKSLKHKLTISLLAVYFICSLGTVFALFSLARVEAKIGNIELLDQLSEMVLETRRYEKNYLLYNNYD
ncbi:hypothetical protein ACFLZ5_11720, partial [Thermodesulfobacteriota bacterium]